MESWQRNHILANFPRLVRDTDCNDLLRSHLLAAEILHAADENILRKLTGHSRNMKFYEILQTRNNAYIILIEALQRVNQTGIAAILEQGIPPSSCSSHSGNTQRITVQSESGRLNETQNRNNFNRRTRTPQTSSAPTADIRTQNGQRQYTYRDDNVVITIKIWELPSRLNTNRDPQFLCHIITQRGSSNNFVEGVMTASQLFRHLEDLNRQYVYPTAFISDTFRVVSQEERRSQTVTFSYRKFGSIFLIFGTVFLVLAVIFLWPALGGGTWLGTGVALKIFTSLGIAFRLFTGIFLGYGATFLSMAED